MVGLDVAQHLLSITGVADHDLPGRDMIAGIHPYGIADLGQFQSSFVVIDSPAQQCPIAAGMFLGPEWLVVPGDAQTKRQIETTGQHLRFICSYISLGEHLATDVLGLDAVGVDKADLRSVLAAAAQV